MMITDQVLIFCVCTDKKMPPAVAVTFQVPDEEKEDFEDDHGQTTTWTAGNVEVGVNTISAHHASMCTGAGGTGSMPIRPSLKKSVTMTPSKN